MNFVKSWGFCVFFSFAASFPQCGDILKANIEVYKSLGKGDEGESYSRKKGGAIPQTYLLQARGAERREEIHGAGEDMSFTHGSWVPSASLSSLQNLLSGKTGSQFSAILD